VGPRAYGEGYKSPNNEIGWACSIYGDRRGEYRVLMVRPDGKRPLGRPNCR